MENIYQLVWDKSQKYKPQYRNWCSVFSFTHNLEYNTWISMWYDDIDKIGNEAKAKKRLSDNDWGWTDVFEIWYNVSKEKTKNMKPSYKLIKLNKNSIWAWLNRWYAVRVWFSCNNEFLKDRLDGKIDIYKNYDKYKWTSFKHFFNIALDWEIWREPKQIAIDNYFWDKTSIYEINFKEFKKLMYPTCYLVVPV